MTSGTACDVHTLKAQENQAWRSPCRAHYLYGDLLLWMSRCLCKENGVRNRALHSSHWNGLSSECVCRRETRVRSIQNQPVITTTKEPGFMMSKREEGKAGSILFLLGTYVHHRITRTHMQCSQEKNNCLQILILITNLINNTENCSYHHRMLICIYTKLSQALLWGVR